MYTHKQQNMLIYIVSCYKPKIVFFKLSKKIFTYTHTPQPFPNTPKYCLQIGEENGERRKERNGRKEGKKRVKALFDMEELNSFFFFFFLTTFGSFFKNASRHTRIRKVYQTDLYFNFVYLLKRITWLLFVFVVFLLFLLLFFFFCSSLY